MIKHLQITLDNGKTGKDLEQLFILCTEGPYYWTYHICHETDAEGEDIAEVGSIADQVEDGIDTVQWWFELVNDAIERLFDLQTHSAAILKCIGNHDGTQMMAIRSLDTAWTWLNKEMFAEDRWTERTN